MIINTPKYKNIILEQLNNAEIKREKTKFYNLTFFEVENGIERLPEDGKSGIILEMIINSSNQIPIDILLHSKNGYIYELEVYNADSSELDYDMTVNDYYIVAESE